MTIIIFLEIIRILLISIVNFGLLIFVNWYGSILIDAVILIVFIGVGFATIFIFKWDTRVSDRLLPKLTWIHIILYLFNSNLFTFGCHYWIFLCNLSVAVCTSCATGIFMRFHVNLFKFCWLVHSNCWLNWCVTNFSWCAKLIIRLNPNLVLIYFNVGFTGARHGPHHVLLNIFQIFLSFSHLRRRF